MWVLSQVKHLADSTPRDGGHCNTSVSYTHLDEGSSGDGVEDGGVGVLVGLWGDVVHYVVLQDIQVVAKRIKVALQGVDVSLHRRAVGLVGERRCPRSFCRLLSQAQLLPLSCLPLCLDRP